MCNSPIRKWSRRRPARISRGRLSFYVEPGRDRWHSRVWEVAAIINHSSPKQRQKNRQPAWRGRPTNTNSQDAPRRRRKHWHAVRTVPAPKNSRSYSSYAERVRHRERKRDRKGEKKKKKKKRKEKYSEWRARVKEKKKGKKKNTERWRRQYGPPLLFLHSCSMDRHRKKIREQLCTFSSGTSFFSTVISVSRARTRLFRADVIFVTSRWLSPIEEGTVCLL